MKNSRIIGTGSYAPPNVISNNDLSKIVDTSDEWIYSRTGIKSRRIAKEENTLELAYQAAERAIENSGIDKKEIQLIIISSVTPENFTPSTASLLQAKLGLNDQSMICFDINAACSGFIYATQIANSFIISGQVNTALVIGSETLSKVTNWQDRNTCVLFGDGAGAVIIQGSDEKGIITTYTDSKGDEDLHLHIPGLGLNFPFDNDNEKQESFIKMNGREIFKFATTVVKKSIEKVLSSSQVNLSDIKYIVPHQANQRIIAKVARDLGIDINKFYLNLESYGNTSSASIGLALDEMNQQEMLQSGDKIILVGFGGGLTWGAILINWI